MPTYQYRCDQCGHTFDQRLRIDEGDGELRCPRCGAGRPHRVFSLFSTFSTGGSCAPRGGG